METVEITVTPRTGKGKSTARKLRRQGTVPAVLYGRKRAPAHVEVSAAELERKVVHLEGSHLIRLLAPGNQADDLHDRVVLLRELQQHPVTGMVLHVDFMEIDLTERLAVMVSLHFVGKAAGVVAGGILQPILRSVEVECLPTEIPEFIEVDVSPLGIHEAIHIADLKLPENVIPLGEPTQTVVTVLPPTVEEKKPEVAAAEGVAVEGAPAEGAAPAPEAAPAPAKKGTEE
jgi:large subunit ribosomal protein L25